MKDTPTKNIMNIALLNIAFAIVGIAIAIVPFIVVMNRPVRPANTVVDTAKVDTLDIEPEVKELEHAA